MTDDGSGGSAYAGPRVRVRRGRRAKFPTRYLVSIDEVTSMRLGVTEVGGLPITRTSAS